MDTPPANTGSATGPDKSPDGPGLEDEVDEAGDETFPASDPPSSWGGPDTPPPE